MIISPQPQPATPGPQDPAAVRDFVAVDDSGAFSYHRSEADLIAAFEYVNEATCIIDRGGMQYLLALDPRRKPVLGPAVHKVDFDWLDKAWTADHKSGAGQHKLLRFHPETHAGLLADLFETLELEEGGTPGGGWELNDGGNVEQLASLADVDRRLGHGSSLNYVTVRDPYGHLYRPAMHHRDWSKPFTSGYVFYVEVPRKA